jgi:hypothetical protein
MLENPLSNTNISEQKERKLHVHCVTKLGNIYVGYENKHFECLVPKHLDFGCVSFTWFQNTQNKEIFLGMVALASLGHDIAIRNSALKEKSPLIDVKI